MRLRNRKSFMTTLPEDAPPVRRGARITHRIYLLVLLSLLVYLAYIAFDRMFFLQAWGQVEVEKIAISSSRGGRIETLVVGEGDRVPAGGLVARIAAPQECRSEDDPRVQRLHMDVQLSRSRISVLGDRLRDRRARADELGGLRRALEIDTRTSREARELADEVDQLEQELALARQRLRIEQQQAARLAANLAARPLAMECAREELRAPKDATVLYVGYKTSEVVTRAQTIVTLIPARPQVRVETYLDSDQLDAVQVGKKMTVEFSDGTKGRGVVEAIYSSAYRSAYREWQDYMPLPSRVRVHVVPENATERQRWLAYDRMDVRVRARQ